MPEQATDSNPLAQIMATQGIDRMSFPKEMPGIKELSLGQLMDSTLPLQSINFPSMQETMQKIETIAPPTLPPMPDYRPPQQAPTYKPPTAPTPAPKSAPTTAPSYSGPKGAVYGGTLSSGGFALGGTSSPLAGISKDAYRVYS